MGSNVSSSASLIALNGKRKSSPGARAGGWIATLDAPRTERLPFLRIPPFPGAKVHQFSELHSTDDDMPSLVDVVSEVRTLRVGGTYWGAQPQLPAAHVLVRSSAALDSLENFAGEQIILWDVSTGVESEVPQQRVSGVCDPWHMLKNASALVIDKGDEVGIIAALMNVDCFVWDPTSQQLKLWPSDPSTVLREIMAPAYMDPFTGQSMNAVEALRLCGFWRRLIDANRGIRCGLGFAFWKQEHIAPLLWSGPGSFEFLRTTDDIPIRTEIAIWRAKSPRDAVRELERKNVALVEVEDGFLRSRGLGADCVPPLSITVDRLRPHFDPAGESDLENLLQTGNFDEALLARARRLRRVILEEGLGKYERGTAGFERPVNDRPIVFVPGQVEDDRAVQTGGCGLVSNLELLRRVREQAPGAFILYKPHPDVLAGHRRGSIPERLCLQYADQVVNGVSIASVLAIADEVHVNTSLAGFEALLRGKLVTTHGVPFYAGWGLTKDLGPVPARRTARRTIDELVAATLLLYPRYLDPLTRLPCPAEVVLERLTSEDMPAPGMLVGMRRFQGKLMRRLRGLIQ
jgi:capsular polysaccharide export protein